MWYKIATIINGPEKGLNYQSFGHKDDPGFYLWWFDNKQIQTIDTETSKNKKINHESLMDKNMIPKDVLFSGRYSPSQNIVTVYNNSHTPLLDKYFEIVQKALYNKFGNNIKIYKFFEYN